MRAELIAALCLLTRLPVSRFGSAAPIPLGRIVWAFPIAGALAGLAGAAAYAACWWIGTPPAIAALWGLAAMLLATGAFHEDGLADTADGFGGGHSRERKLEIMRDSRIGSFGALALVLSVAARAAAIAALARPLPVLLALIAAGALSRAAMVLLLLTLNPGRPDGLAAGLRDLPRRRAALALALALLLAALLLPAGTALRATAGALAAALAMGWIARRQIGGFTGDVLGATAVIAECAALSLIAAAPFTR